MDKLKPVSYALVFVPQVKTFMVEEQQEAEEQETRHHQAQELRWTVAKPLWAPTDPTAAILATEKRHFLEGRTCGEVTQRWYLGGQATGGGASVSHLPAAEPNPSG